MSILRRRTGEDALEMPRAVAFVTRKSDKAADERRLYDQIVQFERECGDGLVVVACDEMGVCLSHRSRVANNLVRGLPAYFFDIRRRLRHLLCETYGCEDAADASPDEAPDETLHRTEYGPGEAVRRTERELELADAKYHAVSMALQGLPDRDARLAPFGKDLRMRRRAYGRALHRWLVAGTRDTAARLQPDEDEPRE